MGMTRTPEAKEMLFARSYLVMHAVAFDLQSIDMVCLDFKNDEVLRKEAVEGRQMGYTGDKLIRTG
jgi:citrate lyase subunit beta-like protein